MRFAPAFRTNSAYSLFDDVFNAPFFTRENRMKTDIVEQNGKYILTTELPGYAKEDVKMSLYNGTLTIEASRKVNSEEKNDEGRVIRRERFENSCSRSFYVGNQVHEEDITASFADGILRIEVPSAAQNCAEEKHYIAIE